jgi:hypothetical protein
MIVLRTYATRTEKSIVAWATSIELTITEIARVAGRTTLAAVV